MGFIIPVTLFCLFCVAVTPVLADIGTAVSYDPPYTPTKCGGNSPDQFPEGGMFVAASNGLWDNGAACGRRYQMRCISGPKRPCKDGLMVVEVVDVCRTNPCPATFLLSNRAFNAISKNPNAKINIEYAQI
ncbi:Eg45-like domain containing protein [Thalictrum thalictroides]|uniref:Eg45-like domain containing protein n=1 Tax=Thalictrum thalictroides TaxID=46969 RepID=A0A7J6VRJ5_THATH|nr:Eg45-like domain containing protein [Thalictrum thalictroides]